MRRVVLIFTILISFILPCSANDFFEKFTASNGRNVFIYHIPDEGNKTEDEIRNNTDNDNTEEKNDIISDDVTADTSGAEYYDVEDIEDLYDDVGDMYSYVLKGYAEYNEEDVDAVSLEIYDYEIPVLSIRQPVPVGEKYFAGLKTSPSLFDNNVYSRN